MSPTRVLMPLSSRGFDPTETGAPWQILTAAPGVEVEFATPDGEPGEADSWMLEPGEEGLTPFGRWLTADQNGRAAYQAMASSTAFRSPITYDEIVPSRYDGLLLPGGHAPGIREYLESPVLQTKLVAFFDDRKPVGAICHGVVMAARCRRNDGTSVLDGYRTTALTEQMETFAWRLTRHLLPVKASGYSYRTYPDTTVEEGVTQALGAGVFDRGPQALGGLILPDDLGEFATFLGAGAYLTPSFSNTIKEGFARDRLDWDSPAFLVEDGPHTVSGRPHYISARWPGDAFTFGKRFLALLQATPS